MTETNNQPQEVQPSAQEKSVSTQQAVQTEKKETVLPRQEKAQQAPVAKQEQKTVVKTPGKKDERPAEKKTLGKPGEKKEEKTEEKKVVLERIYTIPLVQVFNKPYGKRRAVAAKFIRKFCLRHAKATSVSIAQEINFLLSPMPPKSLRVSLKKFEDGSASVMLA